MLIYCKWKTIERLKNEGFEFLSGEEYFDELISRIDGKIAIPDSNDGNLARIVGSYSTEVLIDDCYEA